MTINEIMQPFVVVIEWMRNTTFYLGGFPFTFMELFVWQLFASVVIGFIVKIKEW